MECIGPSAVSAASLCGNKSAFTVLTVETMAKTQQCQNACIIIVSKGITRLIPINADSKDLDIDVEIYTIFRCESGFLASVDLFPF